MDSVNKLYSTIVPRFFYQKLVSVSISVLGILIQQKGSSIIVVYGQIKFECVWVLVTVNQMLSKSLLNNAL